jgi:hypothetical protein
MSGTDKRKFLVVEKDALRGLIWTVCQFCTIVTKIRG